LLHAVDLRHRPYPFEKVLRERWAVMPDEDVLWACWDVMHAVMQKAFVDALHKFIHRAHFGWTDKFDWESQPCVLVPFA
jgi:hypothetical protein